MEITIPCYKNFTTFPQLFYVNTSELINKVNNDECIDICRSLDNCTGVNYYVSNQCELFNNELYNRSLFRVTEESFSGFYMKSHQNCPRFMSIYYSDTLIFGILGMVLVIFIICQCIIRKGNSISRSNSRSRLIEETIPPPYNPDE